MFTSDLTFYKALMAGRHAGRSRDAARRVYRLPAERPGAREAAGRRR